MTQGPGCGPRGGLPGEGSAGRKGPPQAAEPSQEARQPLRPPVPSRAEKPQVVYCFKHRDAKRLFIRSRSEGPSVNTARLFSERKTKRRPHQGQGDAARAYVQGGPQATAGQTDRRIR